MTDTIEVKTVQRTVVQYLTKPVIKTFIPSVIGEVPKAMHGHPYRADC